MITFDNYMESSMPLFHIEDEYKGALAVIQWSYNTYKDNVVYACSFGIEGIVLIDLISKVYPSATIVFLDTNVHFLETYTLIDKIKDRYPTLNIVMKEPSLTLDAQTEIHGAELWKRNPNLCCNIRKVIPLQEVLGDVPAWISGLRREQSDTRKETEFINKDNKFKNIKICPLIHWTWKDIWKYVSQHNLTYNPLHDQGYPSIGCSHCTNKAIGDDLRSGRWENSKKTECGLHE